MRSYWIMPKRYPARSRRGFREVETMEDYPVLLNLQKRRLEEVFIPLARKHKLTENEAFSFLRELEEALQVSKVDERSFEETLDDVRKKFEQLVVVKEDVEFERRLTIFDFSVESLLNKLSEQPKYRCHLAILLPKVVSAWRRAEKFPTKEQFEATKNLLDNLLQKEPSKDDVMKCADFLEEVGIRTTIQSNALADAIISWADEGFPGREYGEDIFGDDDTNSETPL